MYDLVRKTATKLADGRELFYFDDNPEYVSGAKTRRLDDPRPLPDRYAPVTDEAGVAHPVAGPEMRRDPLTGDWIPMASHRMNRTFLPPADANPLGPARPGATYQDGEVPDTDYDVVVFENRFPSLMGVPEGQGLKPGFVDGCELWPSAPAAGRCEVVCFGPRIDQNVVDMGPGRMRTIIEAWADRTAELSKLPGIRQVYCFENHGQDIGVTLSHPHGQIYAYPYLTPRTTASLQRAQEWEEAHPGSRLVPAVVNAEIESGRRLIARNDQWVLYVPAAAKWPVEMQLAPLRPAPDLAALDEAQRVALADMYLRMLIIGDHFFPAPPGYSGPVSKDGKYIPINYISSWNQAPVGPGRDQLSLYLQFFSFLRSPGKLKYLAGSESGMAAWISDTTPEKIADRLRAAAQEALTAGEFAGLEVATEFFS